ncbi:9028_t:CDS:1, partial [Scutellospora calospora]
KWCGVSFQVSWLLREYNLYTYPKNKVSNGRANRTPTTLITLNAASVKVLSQCQFPRPTLKREVESLDFKST